MSQRVHADNQLRCSFCNKTQKVLCKLIASPSSRPKEWAVHDQSGQPAENQLNRLRTIAAAMLASS